MRCPDRNELIQLNEDDLPSDHSESLFDHLESCQQCATVFEQLAESTNSLGGHLAGIPQKDIQKARIEKSRIQRAREKIAKRPGNDEHDAPPEAEPWESQYALSPGQKLEKYEIIRLLDTGGMGEVYEARHGLMRHRVAIKVIRGRHQDNPVAYQKFLTEMKTLARVKHPNLVRALDGGHEDGCLFVVMELLDGDSLHTLCAEGKIGSAVEIIDAMLGLCRGLEKLHAHQLLHRDIKPANIMRLKDGTIKVIDLGLAADNVAGRQMSHVGAGTQGYMPPEQAYGSDSLNERSDIFSAGRVLKDLLRSLRDARANSNQTNAVSRLEKLAEWMTKLEIEDRPQSVKEVLVELKKLRRVMGNSRKRLATATQAAKPQAQPKRRGIGWSVIAVLLIVIIGFGAWQIIFKTDRRATVLVENHQPGDVIQITSEDGKVRSVELGDQPKFNVDRGTYELSLEGPDNRRLNPANITVTGRDQLTLRIEDRPGGFADEVREGDSLTNQPDKTQPSAAAPKDDWDAGKSSATMRRATNPIAAVDEAPWIDLLSGNLQSQWRGSIGTPKQQAGMSTSSRRVAQKQADSMVRQHWRLSGGVLSYDGHPKGPNLSTTREFRNFELSLEWKIAKGGDSGIYLRGLPQVQIWDPNSDKELALQGSGGLYNNQTHSNVPTVRADRPVGQWNEMSIWLIDDKASVELNGRQVVDSIVMENFDDRSQPLYPEGPIELQKHFGPLSFRNIRVRELFLPLSRNTEGNRSTNQDKMPSLHMLPELVAESTASIAISSGGKTVYWDRNGVIWSAERDDVSGGSTFRNAQEWIEGRHLTISGDVGVLLIKQPNRDSETLHEFTLKNGKPSRPSEISTLVPDSGRVFSPHLSSNSDVLCFAGRFNGSLPQLFVSKRSTSGLWTIALPLLRDSQLTDGWTGPSLLDDGKVLLTTNQGQVVGDNKSRYPHNIFVARRTSVNEPFTKAELIDLPGMKSLWFQSPRYLHETGELFVLVQPRSEVGTPTWKPAVIRGVRLSER